MNRGINNKFEEIHKMYLNFLGKSLTNPRHQTRSKRLCAIIGPWIIFSLIVVAGFIIRSMIKSDNEPQKKEPGESISERL